MFSNVNLSYEYFVPSLVYIGFWMFFRYDIYINSTNKYLDVSMVFADFVQAFLRMIIVLSAVNFIDNWFCM